VLLHLFPVSLQTCYLFLMIIFLLFVFQQHISSLVDLLQRVSSITTGTTLILSLLPVQPPERYRRWSSRSSGSFPASYFPIGSRPLCHPSGVIFTISPYVIHSQLVHISVLLPSCYAHSLCFIRCFSFPLVGFSLHPAVI